MQNIVNQDRVTRGARIGKIFTFAGLGLLGAGLVVSLAMAESPLLWLSFVFLLLGLLVSSIGTMNMNHWVREPRADQALAQGLKGFDDRFRLYSYYLPAPHVLLSPMGLYVLTAMGQDGVIRYDGDKFHRDFSLGRVIRFMAEEGLGKPFAEADGQVVALQKLLDEHDLSEEVEIQNLVVFYNPRAELTISAAPRPVATSKGLKKAIRSQQAKLPDTIYQQLGELFDQRVDWD
jgi:hypothetical protein